MTKWKRSSPELIERFQAALPADQRVERRQMFGYRCAFVNGHMFTGLHEENLLVRLGEHRATALIAEGAWRSFAPMPGRVMREYAVVPPDVVARRDSLRRWIDEGFHHALGLPAKSPKRGSPRATERRSPRKGRTR